ADRPTWPVPNRAEWAADYQPAADHQHQMRWADQCLKTTLDAECEMPCHVEHACDSKQHAPKQGKPIAIGQRPPPVPRSGASPRCTNHEEAGRGGNGRV